MIIHGAVQLKKLSTPPTNRKIKKELKQNSSAPGINVVPGAGIEPDPLPYYQEFATIYLQHFYNI